MPETAGTVDADNDAFMIAVMMGSRLCRHLFSKKVGSTSSEHDFEEDACTSLQTSSNVAGV